ncbi:glycosyltransferase family A protein [Dokdonella soli]|uniref:Glycosyltransferase 2-like domain-containing protein n=1 Tax=Dokdonella soli TaxID=529810 RepID=A0ABN1IIG5_9GAMM
MAEISLGIPVFNSARFLDELFNNLCMLDPIPAEIVFLDDASSDDSASRIEHFIAEHGAAVGARLIRSERNAGIAGAYNRLAHEARSDFVQLLDADDILADIDFYARVQPALRDNIDIVITGLRSNARLLDLCSRAFGKIVPRQLPPWWPVLGSFATRAGVIYRRQRLLEAPFPDPMWPGSDVVHLLQLRRRETCVFLAQPRVLYRVHRDAQSSRQRDYASYRHALAQFDCPTRVTHLLDLGLRDVGRRWMR